MAAGLLAKKAVEKGLHSQAVGEDEPRARLEGRDRVPRARRASLRTSRSSASTSSATAARRASATAARSRTPVSKAIDDGRSRRRRGAQRQPQLRRARPRRGARELPRVAAARRRLRARRARSTSILTTEPLGTGKDGKPVFLKDIWPTRAEVEAAIEKRIDRDDVRARLRRRLHGDEQWAKLAGARGRPLRVGRRSPPT